MFLFWGCYCHLDPVFLLLYIFYFCFYSHRTPTPDLLIIYKFFAIQCNVVIRLVYERSCVCLIVVTEV